MGNRPSRAQVIEIKKVEIVKKPQPPAGTNQQNKRKLEDDRGKQKGNADKDAKKPYQKEPAKTDSDKKTVDKKNEKDKQKPSSKSPDEGKDKKMSGDKDQQKNKYIEKGKDKDKKKSGDKDQENDKDIDKGKEKDKKKSGDKDQENDKEEKKAADQGKDKDIKVVAESSKLEGKPERYESAVDIATDTNDVPPKENVFKKVFRLTGLLEMSLKNFLVMFILFSLRFFLPWVYTWWEFNKHLLSDPAHLDELANWLFTQEIICFVGYCLLCVLVSVFADIFNLKYFVYLVLVALYILCPITGLVAINILWARGYNRQTYHRYAPTVYVLMEWAKSVPFIAYPLEFSCFFTQVDDMSREAHYNFAAIFIFLDSLNRLICFLVIPGNCPTLQWTLASAWIAIGIVLHTVFLLSCFFTSKVKRPNKMLNRSPLVLMVVSLINKVLTKLKMKACLISENPGDTKLDNFNAKATPFMKKMKLILFGLMLIPIVYSAFVIAIMHRLELDEEWDVHEFVSASSMFIFGRVVGVIVIAILLFFLRRNKKIKFLNKFAVTRPDVLALGLPHILIALALVIIASRFGSLLSLNEGDVMIGPVPGDGSVIEVYNADFRNRTVCVSSEKFRPIKVGPRRRETRKPADPGVTMYEITVTIAPRTTPPVYTHEILDFAENSLITYVVSLNESEVVSSDLEAMYNRFQLNRVTGTEDVKPKQVPQLIIINTFMLNTTSYFITVTQFQANFTNRVQIPPKSAAHVMDLVAGRIDYRYENDGSPQAPTPPILDHFEAENYTVWTIVLGVATARNASNETEPYNVIINKYLIMQVAGPNGNELPSKRQLQQDSAIMIGMWVGGIAESGIQVGFIYLFWLDTPIGELRATTLAGFLIAMAIPQQFPRLRLVDIGTGVAVFLLCLQIMFTVSHFIGAIFLYDEAFNFRKRND